MLGHGNNVTVIACIKSDLMYFFIITVTFICVIEAKGQTQFYFYNIRDVFRIEGMFLDQTDVSDVFKIVSRVDDKR